MAPSSPYVLTAPATPLARAVASSPLGGGDNSSGLKSLFGLYTYGSVSAGLNHPARGGRRPLRRASPAPKPLSQYSTPTKSRSHARILDVGGDSSPASFTGSVIVGPWALFATTPQRSLRGEADTLRDTALPFVAIAGDQSQPGSPSFNAFDDFPFHSVEPDELQYPQDAMYLPELGDIEEIAEPTFSALPENFISKCKFQKFNPVRPTSTNFDILMRFGEIFGTGVTRSELKQIFRQCTSCQNMLYADRRNYHQCGGVQVDTNAANFDLVHTLLGIERHSGIDAADLRRITVACDDCKRFCLTYLTTFHNCSKHKQN